MPNWAYCSYRIVGKKEEVQDLYSKLQELQNMNEPLEPNSWGTLWLGCLVTILDTDLRTQDEFENILPYFVGYDGETWNDADGEPIPFEVVAWMLLPKPYESQESEKTDADIN